MTVGGLQRFYETVSVREEGRAYVVFLDARRLQTPRGTPLRLSSRRLAEALAREWDVQGERIVAEQMPFTRLVNTAVDETLAQPETVIRRLTAYAETDLLCHWADYPEDLILRQRSAWQPMLDWAAAALNVCLKPVTGIRAQVQEPASLEALRRHLEALDPISLTAADAAAALTGSIVLTLALAYGRLDAAEAWRISRLDEDYQMERWGADDEALRQAEARRAALETAAAVFGALSPEPAA